MNKVEVLNMEYISMKESVVELKWFDNENNKWVKMRGLIEEVEE